uniref:RNase H type-1 domain-containing protein n=1 Tax=Cannabis sativa TaxID=3483 RepID=A0A803PMR0_CANSA
MKTTMGSWLEGDGSWFVGWWFDGDGLGSWVDRSPVWPPPPDDWIKINCDVKVSCDSMCAMAIARIRSLYLWVATNLLNFSDPFIGEVAACLLAMETVVSQHHRFVLAESDSETVIKTLTGTELVIFWLIM